MRAPVSRAIAANFNWLSSSTSARSRRVGLLNIARTKMQLDQWESALPDAEESWRILRERKGDRDEATSRAANLVSEIKRVVGDRATVGTDGARRSEPR